MRQNYQGSSVTPSNNEMARMNFKFSGMDASGLQQMTEENISQDQDYQAPEISPKKHPMPNGRHRFRELLLDIPAIRRPTN